MTDEDFELALDLAHAASVAALVSLRNLRELMKMERYPVSHRLVLATEKAQAEQMRLVEEIAMLGPRRLTHPLHKRKIMESYQRKALILEITMAATQAGIGNDTRPDEGVVVLKPRKGAPIPESVQRYLDAEELKDLIVVEEVEG